MHICGLTKVEKLDNQQRHPDTSPMYSNQSMTKKIFPMAHALLRFSLGTGFILPVLDRIGVLGAPGNVHVTWGNWTNFVHYTHRLMPYVSVQVAALFSLVATIGEALCGIMLIVGYKVKVAA